MDVLICFNPNKPTLYKERLLTKFIEYSFENALEQLENNNNYPKNQQICNGTLNMTSIMQSFNKYPFSLVCLLDNDIIGIVILDIHELSLIIQYICVNKYKKISNVGKKLIDNTIHIAKLIDLKFITLHSIPSAVGFYKKMGFKFGYIDDEIDYYDDNDDIPFDTNMFLKIGGKKKRKTKKKHNKPKKTQRCYFKSSRV
jgi:ribosomal protein S18 acetylase RimI-like enzyme